eukprot:13947230-Heterocapsa_arctica.AAC.1
MAAVAPEAPRTAAPAGRRCRTPARTPASSWAGSDPPFDGKAAGRRGFGPGAGRAGSTSCTVAPSG